MDYNDNLRIGHHGITPVLTYNNQTLHFDKHRHYFERMPGRKLKMQIAADMISYILVGDVNQLCKEGRLREAMYILCVRNKQSVLDGYACLLRGCIDLKAIMQGRRVHVHMIKTGFKPSVFLANRLLYMYAKCGSLTDASSVFEKMSERNVFSWTTMIAAFVKNGKIQDARHVFDKMPKRNVVSWTAMIAGYTQYGQCEEALELFCQMQQVGIQIDHFTLASVFGACAGIKALKQGQQLHTLAMRTGLESDVFVASALVDMYCKCDCIEDARQVFDKMPERNTVSWNTIIAGYAKCERMEDARKLFDNMSERDVVSWTAMIAGYAQHGLGEKALELFCMMQQEGMKPDQFTFASLLSACTGLAALVHGKRSHARIIRTGFEEQVSVANALVTMYSRCGDIENARHVFDKMPERDVVSWSAMITGYAQHGHGKEALKLFAHMLEEGMRPDEVTFISVLYACSHTGLVNEGRRYFDSMVQDHCITPRADHYACIIDLLGRAGLLDEAEDFINNMPFEPDAGVWGTLLSACRIHGNVELGKRAAECLFELEPQEAGPYVLLSNIYAARGKWNDVAKLRKLMKDRGVKKKPGCSWIEVKNKVHAFSVEDRLHPQAAEIYAMLDRLAGQMEAVGYAPNTNFVLSDME